MSFCLIAAPVAYRLRDMTGIFLRQGSSFVPLREQAYEAETVLQELISEHPEMLAGDDAEHGALLLIRREAGVTDTEDGGSRWSLDHLYLDGAGVPTLVEVKRSSDTRGRREVVAQMLDYAANAATSWNAEQLRVWLEEDAQRRGGSADESLHETFGIDDPEAYWASVRTNLSAERLRLIFVSDAIGPELRRIIEFLNGQMTDTTVLAIEVKQYVDAAGTQQTIVPRVVGQTQQARQAKGTTRRTNTSWNLETVLARLADRDPEEAQVARRLITGSAHAQTCGCGSARAPKTVRRCSVLFVRPGLLVVYTTGTVEARFAVISALGPFDEPGRIETFIEELNAIPGVAFPPGRIDAPTSPLLGLAGSDSLELFAATFERAFDEISTA